MVVESSVLSSDSNTRHVENHVVPEPFVFCPTLGAETAQSRLLAKEAAVDARNDALDNGGGLSATASAAPGRRGCH